MQPNQNKMWVVRKPVDAFVADGLCHCSPVMRQLLYNRGITTPDEAEAYLAPEQASEPDPFLLTGMDQAVERLQTAIQNQEPVAVYGDYDADGVTATVLLVHALQLLGAIVKPYIPNRFEEGYGLNTAALDELASTGTRLVVTVDCGVRSIPEAAHAAALGMDMIITDHHTCGSDLPQAVAIINPHQPGDTYPYKHLTGVGLAYKLARSLVWLNQAVSFRPDEWLDLVAVGTIADMAPLTGENRLLVSRGLNQIRLGWRPGLRSLVQAAGKYIEKIDTHDIGYVLAPRLNAAGRLDTALTAYNLLSTQSEQVTGVLAQQLDDQNRERQKLTQEMQAAAEAQIAEVDDDHCLAFAHSKEFNLGILGLAAARVLETYYRPAIVARINGETTRASCRSIPGFHITEALDQCSELLVMHGGHAAAAGFTVRNENRDALVAKLEAIAAQQFKQNEDLLVKKIKADLRLSLRQLTFDLLADLDRLQPTGIGNPEAVFLSENVEVRDKRVVGNGAHLSLRLSQPGSAVIKAIAFRMGALADALPNKVDVMYSLGRDDFRGETALQLMIKDIAPCGQRKIREEADLIIREDIDL